MQYIDFEDNLRQMTVTEEQEFNKLLNECGNGEAALAMMFGEGTGNGPIIEKACKE